MPNPILKTSAPGYANIVRCLWVSDQIETSPGVFEKGAWCAKTSTFFPAHGGSNLIPFAVGSTGRNGLAITAASAVAGIELATTDNHTTNLLDIAGPEIGFLVVGSYGGDGTAVPVQNSDGFGTTAGWRLEYSAPTGVTGRASSAASSNAPFSTTAATVDEFAAYLYRRDASGFTPGLMKNGTVIGAVSAGGATDVLTYGNTQRRVALFGYSAARQGAVPARKQQISLVVVWDDMTWCQATAVQGVGAVISELGVIGTSNAQLLAGSHFGAFLDFQEPPVITGPGGSTGASSSISVAENTTSVFTFTADKSVTWSLNGGADVARFSINPSTGALSFVTAPDFEVPTDADTNNTYVVGVRATDGASQATTQTCTVTVTDAAEGTAPSITTHPSNQSVVAGSAATFTAAASGSPTPTVQWQRNNVNISGATSTSYTTPAPTVTGGSANNGDTYRAVFTNASGSATSNSATLTVSAAPTAPSITSQPSNQTVTEGATATFSVTATGTAPLSYQWRKNGTNVSGATSSSYTTPATVLADSGALYSVVVSNAAGSVTSGNATLTVNAAGGLAGFDFHTAAGCVFGAISGSLTGLAREVGVSITPYVYSSSTGALVATLATTATNSAGRLPRLTHASLAAATTYRVTFVWPDGAAYTISMAAS